MLTMNSQKGSLLRTLTGMAMVAVASTGWVQSGYAQTGGIEEVIVTAQKRAESMQDVPISMQALTGDDLRELGVKNASDVLNLFANVGSIDAGGPKQNFFIRGVGTSDFHLNAVGAVGVYLDEVSINSPVAVSFSLFDMERVEVLRGPQNTLFGRNTTGGAVNYISRKPVVGDAFSGYAELSYGRFDQLDFEAAVGVPLGDTTAMRIAIVSNNRDGAYDNLTLGQDTGTVEKQAIRMQFLWEPSESTSALLNLHGGRDDSEAVPFKNVGLMDPADPSQPCADAVSAHVQDQPNCVDVTGYQHSYDNWPDVFGGMLHRQEVDSSGASLRLDWGIGGMTLTSISSFDSTEVEYSEDTDGQPYVVFQFYQEGDYDQLSQELRLASDTAVDFRWIMGAFYFSEEAEYVSTARRTPAGNPGNAGPGYFNVVPNTIVNQDNKAYSAYGQVEYDFNDRLTTTLGLRYAYEEKTGDNTASVRCVGTGGPPFCPVFDDQAFIGLEELLRFPALVDPFTEQLDADWTEWGGRWSLDYKLNDDAMVYGSISRGFKAGNFSIAALQALLGNAAQEVDPEILWAYELGFKSELADGTVQLNGAVFYYDWQDLQTFQALFDPVSGIALPQLLNVPESGLTGAELELLWAPAPDWLMQLGLGYIDSEIKDGGYIVGADDGNKLPGAPQWTFNGLLRKEFHIGEGVLSLQALARFTDETTFDIANADILTEGSYWIVNVRGAYRWGPEERYEVAVWGNELTGDEYCRSLTSLQGLAESVACVPSLGRPTYGITASMHF